MKKTLLTFLAIAALSNFTFAQNFTLQNIDDNTTMPDIHSELYEIASGDLDGVGGIDIVVATYDYNGGTPTQDYIKWYSNDGAGNFTIEATISTTIQWVDGLTIADIDGMHGNDIIATSVNQNKLVYFLSDGAGGFGTEVSVDSSINGPGQVVAGDINNDGNTDLVVAVYGDDSTKWYSGNGSGGFTAETDIETGSTNGPYYVAIADFDNDLDMDVLIGFFNTGSLEIFYNQYIESGTMTVSWLMDTTPVETSSTYLFGVAAGDVNNDGNMDAIKVDFSGGLVEWYDKVKNGTSTPDTICDDTIINSPASVYVADLNDDSLNDVIVSDGGVVDDALIWFQGASMANPSDTANTVINNNYIMYDITAGDFDNDLDIDIATIGNSSDTVDWYENDLYTLSVEESSIETISVYPNPAINTLNFKGLSNENHDILITDILGKTVMETSINFNDDINVSQLNSGVYIIKFKNTNTSLKFIKE